MSQKETAFAWREILVILILSLTILAVLPVRLDETTDEAIMALEEGTASLVDVSAAHVPVGDDAPFEADQTVYLETWSTTGDGVELYSRALNEGASSFMAVGEPSYQYFDISPSGEAVRFSMDEVAGTGTIFVSDRVLVTAPLEKGQILSARVSPDGTMLGYTSLCGLGCVTDGSATTTTISVVNMNTGKLLSSTTKKGFFVVRQWIANNRLFLSPELEAGEGEPTYMETYIWHIWNRTLTTIEMDPFARSFDLSEDGTFIVFTVTQYEGEKQIISSSVVRKPVVGGVAVREDAPPDVIYSNAHWLSSDAVVFNKTTVARADWECPYGPCIDGTTEVWMLDQSEISPVMPGPAAVADAGEGIVYYHDTGAETNRDIIRAYSLVEARSIGLIDSPRYVHIMRVLSGK